MIPSTVSPSVRSIVAEIIDEQNFKAEAASKYVVRLSGAAPGVKYLALIGLGSVF